MKAARFFLAATLLFSVAASTPVLAQQPQATKQPAPASAKVKALYGTWTFIGSETFSMPQDPNDAQKNDVLTLNADGTFKFILDGTEHTGKWTSDAAATLITLTDGTSNQVFKLKVLEKTAKRLKVDYRDKDDVHNILIYEMK
ncbi:MAG: lipocalin family protein [Bacteroidia bacterium]